MSYASSVRCKHPRTVHRRIERERLVERARPTASRMALSLT
jgi:hypothetical protein